VACADDSTQVYFAKGTPLPARRTFVHQTVRGALAHSEDDALAIPVVQGESQRAHRNRLVGKLQIRGVKQDLPAGTRIEVTLELDRSGQLHTRADVPALGQTFEDIAHVLVPTASLETSEREINKTNQRVDDVRKRAFQSGMAAVVSAIEDLPVDLAEAERNLSAARGGDLDASQKVHRLLLDINIALDDAEAMLEWPDLEREAHACSLYYTQMVAQWGTPAEQQLFDQALQSAANARRGRKAVDLERALQAMRSVCKASYWRDPQSMVKEMDWLSAHITEATDVLRAQHLIDKARLAHQQGNQSAFKSTLAEVWAHFPGSPEDQRRSFGSGVR
jgi:molecular chaperone DnaK